MAPRLPRGSAGELAAGRTRTDCHAGRPNCGSRVASIPGRRPNEAPESVRCARFDNLVVTDPCGPPCEAQCGRVGFGVVY